MTCVQFQRVCTLQATILSSFNSLAKVWKTAQHSGEEVIFLHVSRSCHWMMVVSIDVGLKKGETHLFDWAEKSRKLFLKFFKTFFQSLNVINKCGLWLVLCHILVVFYWMVRGEMLIGWKIVLLVRVYSIAKATQNLLSNTVDTGWEEEYLDTISL